MYKVRTFGTACVGVSAALLLCAAVAVCYEGVGSLLASQAATLAFVLLAIGVAAIALTAAAYQRSLDMPTRLSHLEIPAWRDGTFDYSIIIPIFNRPEHLLALHGRIESLLPEWSACGSGEIVVVNDGSTDQTLAVAMRLSQQSALPMRIVTQPNKGVSGARNRGFWEARGTIGIVIDSDCLPDDQWLPSMIEAVRSSQKALVFATVYSDRRARFPLEATPAGAPFAGASFAARVSDYIELGGNFEEFSGASRDDGDLYLCSRRLGFHTVTVASARVWHPIRTQSPQSAYRAGLAHRFDGLLLGRHRDRALYLMGDWILGGSFVGNYPISLCVYALVLLAVWNLVALAITPADADVIGLILTAMSILLLWLIALFSFSIVLNVPSRERLRYIANGLAYGVGCIIGRAKGIVVNGLALL